MDAVIEQQPHVQDDLPSAYGKQLPTPSSTVERILSSDVDRTFIERVPIAFSRRFNVLGLTRNDGVLPVALSEKSSLPVLDKLTTLLAIPTQPIFVDTAMLKRAINEAYGQHDPGVSGVISEMTGQGATEVIESLTGKGDLLDTSGASPVTRLVNLMLLESVQRRASDIHLQPFEDRLQVRLRIDGVLYDYVQPPFAIHQEIVSRIKVMGRMNIAEKRLPQDGRTTVQVGDKTIDLRINSLPTSFGERIVLRLLDKSARLYHLAELGMNDRDLAAFRRLIRQNHGIVLVTGPTGSGKSTTLYAALQELNGQELNIVTLEDPIEYQLPGISQCQVSDKKGMTFATGLRTVLRQDPDVIMVGEIRDNETARMAIQSSLTGHLVFSTLHTNDSAGAIARLLDLGIEPYLVAGSLLGVIAQRLVRRVCPHCRVPHKVHDADAQALRLAPDRRDVFNASRCSLCHETGYYDRVGIYETLVINEELHDLIVSHPKTRLLKAAARRAGMTTLREEAVQKLVAGVTTVDEVLAITNSDE